MKFILKNKVLFYLKNSLKLVALLLVAVAIVFIFIIIKYKPVYKVTFSGEEVGFITNKNSFEKIINENLLTMKEANVVDIALDNFPEYNFTLVEKSCNTNEEEILNKISDSRVITYKMYAITFNGENDSYVNSIEEAEEVVNKIKSENSDVEGIELGITEIYTKNLEELNTVKVAEAETEVNNKVTKIKEENEKKLQEEKAKEANTFNRSIF